MSRIEREREVLEVPLSAEYLQEKERQGWRAVAVEWQREAGVEAATALRTEEIPYGLKAGDDPRHLVEDPEELQTMTQMLASIVADKPLSAVAEELNARGLRRRNGSSWTQGAIFNLLPRLIEVAPRIYSTEEWRERSAASARWSVAG